MKTGKKILAFLVTFLMMFGSGFTTVALADDEDSISGTSIKGEISLGAKVDRTWQWEINKEADKAQWDVFKGDQVETKYTVSVEKKSYTDKPPVLAGTLKVMNKGGLDTKDLKISVLLSVEEDGSWKELDDVITLSPAEIAAGKADSYDYEFKTIPEMNHKYKATAKITITNHSGHLGEAFGPSPSDDTFYRGTGKIVDINGSVHVFDSIIPAGEWGSESNPWEFNHSDSREYKETFGADISGKVENTATIKETKQTAKAEVTIKRHDLQVTKTVNTSYKREYHWDIEKKADQTNLALATGEKKKVNYTVKVTATPDDSCFVASGIITVTNPAPIDAWVTGVFDIPGAGIVALEPAMFPRKIKAGEKLELDYSLALPNTKETTNTAKAVLQNSKRTKNYDLPTDKTTEFSCTVGVNFGAPATVADDHAKVVDDKYGILDEDVSATETMPVTFKYAMDVGPYAAPGVYHFDNKATVIAGKTEKCSAWRVNANVTETGTVILKKVVANYSGSQVFKIRLIGTAFGPGKVEIFNQVIDVPANQEVPVTVPYGCYAAFEDPAGVHGFALVSINPLGVFINDKSKSATITVTNRGIGSLTITKVIRDGIQADTEFTFTVTQSGSEWSKTLKLNPSKPDKKSETIPDLPFGTYIITETPKTGFRVSGFSCEPGVGQPVADKPYSYQVTIGSAEPGAEVSDTTTRPNPYAIKVTCTNEKLYQIGVTKTDASGRSPLSCAVFGIFATQSGDPLEKVTTGSDGKAVGNLWYAPGTYYVRELTPPAGYRIDNPAYVAVAVSAGTTNVFYAPAFTDSLDFVSTGSVLVQKFSSYGGGKIPVAGVKFQLLNKSPKDAGFGDVNIVSTGTTDINGQVGFSGLPIGGVYWVREVEQAPGYDIDKSLVLGPYTIGGGQSAYAVFINNPLGRVSITKYDAATVSGSDYSKATKLAGAVYGIFASTDYTKAPVAKVTTSAAGAVQSVDLPFGGSNPATYYIKEITAPAGYGLSDAVQTVSFTTPGQIAELVFTDTKGAGTLIIKKVSALDKTKTLAGAQFTLFADEKLTTVIGTKTTGDDGLIRFDNLAPGTYWLLENEAPQNYDLLPDKLKITVTAAENPEPLVIQNQYNPPEDISTGMMDWNVLLVGFILLMGGGLFFFSSRRRKAGSR